MKKKNKRVPTIGGSEGQKKGGGPKSQSWGPELGGRSELGGQSLAVRVGRVWGSELGEEETVINGWPL